MGSARPGLDTSWTCGRPECLRRPGPVGRLSRRTRRRVFRPVLRVSQGRRTAQRPGWRRGGVPRLSPHRPPALGRAGSAGEGTTNCPFPGASRTGLRLGQPLSREGAARGLESVTGRAPDLTQATSSGRSAASSTCWEPDRGVNPSIPVWPAKPDARRWRSPARRFLAAHPARRTWPRRTPAGRHPLVPDALRAA